MNKRILVNVVRNLGPSLRPAATENHMPNQKWIHLIILLKSIFELFGKYAALLVARISKSEVQRL